MMLEPHRDDAAHRRRHDGARLRPHHQHRVAQREDSAARARPVERRALRPRRLRRPASRARPWRTNVTINNLLPGIFDSDAQRRHIEGMLEDGGKSFDDIWRERARAQARPQRYGNPAELGAYCAFLCSAQAGFITGQNLLIDGGSYPGTF